jgi:hypothetical protein
VPAHRPASRYARAYAELWGIGRLAAVLSVLDAPSGTRTRIIHALPSVVWKAPIQVTPCFLVTSCFLVTLCFQVTLWLRMMQ